MKRVRRAFVCGHKDCNPPRRIFVGADDPAPKCPEHGKMVLQPNKPYMGRKVP
jgi:hypothetical protein